MTRISQQECRGILEKYVRIVIFLDDNTQKGNNCMAGFVQLKDITKVYKMGEVEIRAVDGISFEIEKGEFVVIVGPSGAGKTTVLNILGGMDTASSGRILVMERILQGIMSVSSLHIEEMILDLYFSFIIWFRI